MKRLPGVAVVAAVLIISGCATPSPAADPRPAPSTTPTVEPVVEAAPGSRVPATCDELVPAASVEALIGPSAVLAAPITDGAFGSALAHEGVLTCSWDVDDAAHARGVTVIIAPFPPEQDEIFLSGAHEGLERDSVVAGSWRGCYAEALFCAAGFRASEYRVELHVNDPSSAPEVSAAEADTDVFARSLAERLVDLEPLPRWTPPEVSTPDYVGLRWDRPDAGSRWSVPRARARGAVLAEQR